jgi:PAS domain S-box-containing protein
VSLTAASSGEYETYDMNRFFNYALDMLCIAGVDGYFKRVNPAFERTLGYSTEEILSKPFVELIHPDDRTGTLTEIGKLASGKPTLSFENRYRCKDGSYKDLAWTSYPEPGTGLLYAIARDVTDQKRRDDWVDALTRTATRRAFEEHMPNEWNRAARLATPLALAVIDVDRFRDFNHRSGHEAGDEFLKRLADLLREHARRAGDLVARFGGQQFVFTGGRGGDASSPSGGLTPWPPHGQRRNRRLGPQPESKPPHLVRCREDGTGRGQASGPEPGDRVLVHRGLMG